ncbi:MAG: hypothetical protein ACI9J3_001898 [Parvicellaceae bacterium]|jgi:hypothetical protein
MKQEIIDYLAQDSVQLSLIRFAINLAITAVLASILALVFRRFGRSLSNRMSFAANFVLIAMTTMVIITIVKSSLALSLGLVGALSIVRFRAAIKEPEELGYLFLSIAIGLGMGANQLLLTIVSFLMIVSVIVITRFSRWKKQEQNLYVTIGLDSPTGNEVNQVVEILSKHCSAVKLKRVDSSTGLFEASFLVSFSDFKDLEESRKDLNTVNDNYKLTYLDNSFSGA